MKSATASIRIENGRLSFDHFEAKSGNHGHIKARGSLPMLKKHILKDGSEEISLDLSHLELKANKII